MEPQKTKIQVEKASVRPMTRQHGTITLLPAEKLLRELLLNCREHMQKSQIASAFGLEMWITGGWVRDRLLGIPCSDIDIALSTITGEQFSHSLTEFFEQNKEQYQQRAAELGVQDTRLTGFHTTKKNLGKSKKLETTIGRVFGLDLDLLNLRKEVYEDNSRTPEMEFGTAEEDAFRRDATVNTLFFNLDKQEVVDLTKKGLDDMAAGIIRTPLEPRQTFTDDPLRVLRLIRIGSKLGYTVDEETKKWMKDQDIHTALDGKVSRERIGIEVFKIMKQPNPQVAFHLLFEANLYTLVFLRSEPSLRQALLNKLPAQDPGQPWPSTWPRAYQTLAMLIDNNVSGLGRMVQSEERVENLWVMAAYAPIAELRHDMLKKVVDEATDAVKATSKISKLLESSLRNMDSINATVALASDPERPAARSTVGMAIRAWGSTWRLQVVYSLLAALVYETSSTSSLLPSLSTDDDPVLRKLLLRYNTFIDFVMQRGLEKADLLRPMFDGNAIMQVFGVHKGGSFLKTAIDELVAWQFDHEGLGAEEARKWLYQQRDMLGIPPGSV
ncbi:putative poly(A) polymerase [Durotheca rogersii]|uniref:putative poly(A) polymerase n=1 Tax=Durotheca rogersii TaxID=419775 RepID=UPI002221079A|nr:putative poly(A) polymerase [Durotheca rogersii]KAI5861926.1 putative poly(A) polymerase [Durotheca rogersii]